MRAMGAAYAQSLCILEMHFLVLVLVLGYSWVGCGCKQGCGHIDGEVMTCLVPLPVSLPLFARACIACIRWTPLVLHASRYIVMPVVPVIV